MVWREPRRLSLFFLALHGPQNLSSSFISARRSAFSRTSFSSVVSLALSLCRSGLGGVITGDGLGERLAGGGSTSRALRQNLKHENAAAVPKTPVTAPMSPVCHSLMSLLSSCEMRDVSPGMPDQQRALLTSSRNGESIVNGIGAAIVLDDTTRMARAMGATHTVGR